MHFRQRNGVVAASCIAVLLITTFSLFAEPGPERKHSRELDPELVDLLARFDEVQASIRCLSTDFTMVTADPMLQEPVSSKGRLYLTKPDSVRWEFSLPEEMAFVIANGEYIGYYPARKKAERRDFHRWSEQVFRYFGLGQGSVELSRMYDITLEDAADAPDGVRVLRLEPKKRRARKRIEEVQLWVSEKTWLPVRVEYQTRDGGNREIVFRGMQVNPDLATGLYEVNLPPDVQVTRGASGLGTALQTSPGPGSH